MIKPGEHTQQQLQEIINNPGVIVQYKGGGFEGCFWQWNFFHIDGHNSGQSIYRSGVDGAETIEKLL